MAQFRLIFWLFLLCFWSVFSYANKEKVSEVEPLTSPQKPSLILLKTYHSDLAVEGWLMSEKLDGVRAYWDGKQLLSRNGNRFFAPEWFVNSLPPFELDGELWLGREQFQETVSIVTRKQPDERWMRVTYQIFEVPNQSGGLLNRLSVLQAYLDKNPTSHLKVIKQKVVKNSAEVQQALQKIIALQGEGLVLRRGDREYYTGRSNDALKVKLKQDAECVVVGYTEGKGKYLGQIGALKCELLAGEFLALKRTADRVIKIGSGLSDALREEPPPIGTRITFQYMGLTQKGLPRFPVFLRVRASLGSE